MLIEWLKKTSNFIARYKGLPVLIGVCMVLLNFILQLFPPLPLIGWLANVNLFLHIGIIVGLVGILIGDAL